MKIQIENYENMTPEEKIAAWEAYEPDYSGYVRKDVFDKTASDLAAAKKTIREKMTEDEAKAQQAAEEIELLRARVEELDREKKIGTYANAYLGMGYAEDLARSTAEALANGDTETVFANQKKHTEAREKALRAELLKSTPAPANGNPAPTVTKETLSRMTLAQRQEFALANREAYENIYKKE